VTAKPQTGTSNDGANNKANQKAKKGQHQSRCPRGTICFATRFIDVHRAQRDA
jgi:hypothetical protein